MDLAFVPAVEQARLVREGEVSSLELVELYLERIARLDPELNSFVTVCAEEALARAREIDAGNGAGAFRGVPIGVKDLAATAGIRTTYSSRAFATNVPDFDTAVVRRLRDAGFVILGKTNTPEFGTTAFTESELNGATRNPWDPSRTPGGSSGGAAAALAAGLLPIAHGTDGGGSIRIPASCCGLFGLKPSRGRVSTAPFTSLEGLSTAGPIARTVADAAAFLDVIAGYEPGDPWWTPPPVRPFAEEPGAEPGRLRIAVTTTPPVETCVDSACASAATNAGVLLEELGHEVFERTPPWSEPDVFETFVTIWQVTPTLFPVHDPSLLTPLNRGLAESAAATSAVAYAQAAVRMQLLARRCVAFWQEVDVVLTPALALPPVPIGWQEEAEGAIGQLMRSVAFTPFTAIANVTGLPAISLPLGRTGDGLPVGVQALGPPVGEALLLRLATQIEEAQPWRDERPPIS
ncbi:MAG: amidase [Actinobacteria bacterium]|nr:MAG: amidase [Actinomycetota bacterium]